MTDTLKPFVTDGCSGFLSFAWRAVYKEAPPWEGCCLTHDKAYWKGGPKHLRKEADLALRKCVSHNGHPWWAIIMYVAVRIGGPWWLPFPSLRRIDGNWYLSFMEVRWGYGWPYPQYKANVDYWKCIHCGDLQTLNDIRRGGLCPNSKQHDFKRIE